MPREKFKRLFPRRACKFHRHKQFPETVRDGKEEGEREREVEEGEEKEELETSFFAARDFRLSHKQPSRHPLSGEKCRHHPLESTPILLPSSFTLFVNSWHAYGLKGTDYSIIVRNQATNFSDLIHIMIDAR